MPPLKMGITIIDELEGLRATPMNLNPKAFQKNSLRSSQKQKIDFEILEEEEQQNKKERLYVKHHKKIPKAI